MKLRIALVAFLALVPSARAAVSIDYFYDTLSPYGEWIDVADYGYVWRPRDVEKDWRPYTAGHWVYTDAGWTWVSDEKFGWVTYHYGRWADLDEIGWVWVPDTEWAPAWVSWRSSDRHIGWAPLPPEARFTVEASFGDWVDGYYDIGPGCYSFVDVRNFGAPHLFNVLLPIGDNITYVRESQNVTNIITRNNIVINEGPRFEEVSRLSAQPIRQLRLDRQRDISGSARNLAARVEGDRLAVPAPAVTLNRDAAPQRVAQRVGAARVNHGWAGSNQQELQRLRASVKQQAKVPEGLPATPRFTREEQQRNQQATSTTPESRQQSDAERRAAQTPDRGTKQGPAVTTERERAEAERRAAETPDRGTPSETRGRPGREVKTPESRGTEDVARPDRSKQSTAPEAKTPDSSERVRRPESSEQIKDGAEKPTQPGKSARPDKTSPRSSQPPDTAKRSMPREDRPSRVGQGPQSTSEEPKNRPSHSSRIEQPKAERQEPSVQPRQSHPQEQPKATAHHENAPSNKAGTRAGSKSEHDVATEGSSGSEEKKGRGKKND